MKRPWHFWFLYLLTLVLVTTAMTWLTLKGLELDRSEAVARRHAELEEDISRALWRMDVRLMPILAQEAARPYFVYRPLVADASDTTVQPTQLSPLLSDKSDYVLVNFEVNRDDIWSSPQSPKGEVLKFVCSAGASPAAIQSCSTRLGELQKIVGFEALFNCLPVESLPDPKLDQQKNESKQPTPQSGQFVKNTVDIDRLKQQLEKVRSWSPAELEKAPDTLSEYSSGRLQRSQSRIGNDFQTRDSALQMYTEKELTQQRSNWAWWDAGSLVREGVSQPVWIGPQLLLARRVEMNDRVVIQGCWLDWPRLEKLLREEVANLLPDVKLEPVNDPGEIKVSRMLATLPVQLVVPSPNVTPAAWSAMRISLATAWTCLLLAAVAVGLLLHGVLALSERRGAFVSAVTHELRTPLTTFRMYSEMLAKNMVPDADRRQSYLETLRVEADRLSHLVENVLTYARLERGRCGRNNEVIPVEGLLERVKPRLQERASQARMNLTIEALNEAHAAYVDTDPGAVEQVLFNLVDNACKYAASGNDHRIHVQATVEKSRLHLRVRDHGAGIPVRDAKRLFRPFSKSADEAARSSPGVGLGLALCRRLAGELGGKLTCESPAGGGAAFELTLPIRQSV